MTERGRRLVAAAHQHRAVYRVRAQHLFRFHRQKLRYNHAARLLERLAHRHDRKLDGNRPLPHAAASLSSARVRKCACTAAVSLQVLMIPIRGLPQNRCARSPLQRCAERWPARSNLRRRTAVTAQVFRQHSGARHKRIPDVNFLGGGGRPCPRCVLF